jgi:hypothetical protein
MRKFYGSPIVQSEMGKAYMKIRHTATYFKVDDAMHTEAGS